MQPTVETLTLENLKLKLEVRKLRLQILTLMAKDINQQIPMVAEEAQVLELEIEKLMPKKLEAVK